MLRDRLIRGADAAQDSGRDESAPPAPQLSEDALARCGQSASPTPGSVGSGAGGYASGECDPSVVCYDDVSTDGESVAGGAAAAGS
jgi:hypothetical protein